MSVHAAQGGHALPALLLPCLVPGLLHPLEHEGLHRQEEHGTALEARRLLDLRVVHLKKIVMRSQERGNELSSSTTLLTSSSLSMSTPKLLEIDLGVSSSVHIARPFYSSMRRVVRSVGSLTAYCESHSASTRNTRDVSMSIH